MAAKTKAVKSAKTRGETRVRDGNRREAALYAAALALVKDLAEAWLREGVKGDEPSSALRAYDLLTERGYTYGVSEGGTPKMVPPAWVRR